MIDLHPTSVIYSVMYARCKAEVIYDTRGQQVKILG